MAFVCVGEKIVFSEDGDVNESYIIVDEENKVVSEKSGIEEGDTFITSDFIEYEIYKIDGKKGFARKIGELKVPQIKRDDLNSPTNPYSNQGGNKTKKICLYMTHNDESYVPSDGYDSVYGAGGIHDVAISLKNSLEKKGVVTVLDQTLHVPHNSSAYTRSSVTANKLLNKEKPDAMFDIHRDGVSKSYYAVKQGDKDYSKIRIVVGKSNPNFEDNYKFAKEVFAIGNSMYPWLFLDIYCGKGHYNQALQETDLLFEMGTYLIEKEAVLNSVPLLAEVVNTTLYTSKAEENGDIIVDNNSPITNPSPVANEVSSSEAGSLLALWIVLGIIGGGGVVMAIALIIYKKHKKKSKSNSRNKKRLKQKKAN